ncbi:putative mitochondrial intermembrane space translocase subunit Tim10 [Gonapodya prolifera JEL478]|uniref:Mitochondrial import inner membrane translocase subunit n=1 Tax=Gonapodya prolifera (strain JEL478) TaxID=1344416 RepID=A0A139AJC0_GONPJ|nr:putative mitochondrial intermembrane space translocase subunit Tim10 [Gonapodya prolifera JEL478]|eukprot:KXS16896.1 putative mitochondrial intermembrane space translocase subunit Tim10 [Gonapodya prolifera JEL478]
MSFLFGRGGAQQQQQQSSLNLTAAESELDMITDLFNRIVETCYRKCIPAPYQDGELTKGESVCIDRCVSKYFETNAKVGGKMSGGAAGR